MHKTRECRGANTLALEFPLACVRNREVVFLDSKQIFERSPYGCVGLARGTLNETALADRAEFF
jgi:hypothetical protein